jgi:hypothetical protein
MLLGSVSQHVIFRAPCPVLLVREAAAVTDSSPSAPVRPSDSYPRSSRPTRRPLHGSSTLAAAPMALSHRGRENFALARRLTVLATSSMADTLMAGPGRR